MKKLLLKTLPIVLTAIVLQILLYSTPYRPQIFDSVKEFETELSKGSDTLIFGDSVTLLYARDDQDKRTLGEMIQARLAPKKVSVFAHEGRHMGVYRSYVKYLSDNPHSIRQVLVPVNIRTFSTYMDRRPGFEFNIERSVMEWGSHPIAKSFLFPLMVFKGIAQDTITQKEYDHLPVYHGSQRIGEMGDYSHSRFLAYTDDNARNLLISNYLEPISAEHRRVKDISTLVELCQSKGIVPLFYFTPLDYMEGERLIGEEFATQIKANLDVIKKVLVGHGVKSLDLSFTLPTDHFMWKDHTYLNEHLNQKGRLALSETLAGYLTQDSSLGSM